MRDRSRASFTADAACAARAHGAMHPDVRLRNPDYLARTLVGMPFRVLLWPILRGRFVAEFERRAPGMYFHHQARTKHFDAILLGEIDRGVSQLVVLGAGFDSRAYRFADRLRGARVFEVDHPATSAEKQRRARKRLGADAVKHVTYLAVDFAREDLAARLAAAGFAREVTSYFQWEGVAMYLQPAAVDAMLAFVARAGRGSSITFDYLFRSALEGNTPDAIQHRELAARHGEPFQFGVDPDEVGTLFTRNGLSLASNVGAEEISARYLVGSDGRRWGQAFPLVGIAHGRAL
jgi:methyltransferase (TIGR00027 family)